MRGGTPVNQHFIAYLTAGIICDAFLSEPDSSSICGFSLKAAHFILLAITKVYLKSSLLAVETQLLLGGAGSTDLQLVLGMQIKLEVLSRLGPCVCISRAHCSCFQPEPN